MERTSDFRENLDKNDEYFFVKASGRAVPSSTEHVPFFDVNGHGRMRVRTGGLEIVQGGITIDLSTSTGTLGVNVEAGGTTINHGGLTVKKGGLTHTTDDAHITGKTEIRCEGKQDSTDNVCFQSNVDSDGFTGTVIHMQVTSSTPASTHDFVRASANGDLQFSIDGQGNAYFAGNVTIDGNIQLGIDLDTNQYQDVIINKDVYVSRGDVTLGDGVTDQLIIKATTHMHGTATIYDDIIFSSTFEASMVGSAATVAGFCIAQGASTITEYLDIVGLPIFLDELTSYTTMTLDEELTTKDSFSMVGTSTIIRQNDVTALPVIIQGDFFGDTATIKGTLVANSAVFASTTVHGGNLWLYGGKSILQFAIHCNN
jgi:hypothetical protein